MTRAVTFFAALLALVAFSGPFPANAQNPHGRHAAPARAAPHAAQRPAVRAAPRPAMRAAPRPAMRAAPRPSAPRMTHIARPSAPRARAVPRSRATPHISRRSITATRTQHITRPQRSAPRVLHRNVNRNTQQRTRTATQPNVRNNLRGRAARTGNAATRNRETATRNERLQRRTQRRNDNANIRTNARTPAAVARPNATDANRAATRNDAREQRRLSRDRQRAGRIARLTPETARQGRFAARFAAARAQRHDRQRRFEAVAARRAWRHGHRATFVGWYGPVFWPYAYSDIFDYTFWPSGYDDGYWAYAYDDLFDGVFWGESGPPEIYAYGEPTTGAVPLPSGGGTAATRRSTSVAVRQLCEDPGSGVTAWPFAEITKAVSPTPDQQALLDELKDAAKKAADVFKASCPSANAYPRTPPGRLRAMMARLLATLQAVQTVRPPLEKFYDSLNDEQKARFNDIGPQQKGGSDEAEQAQASASDCKQAKPGLSNLPIDKIEQVVKPTDAQEDALSNLEDATEKAVGILQAACPDETPLTPVGRLEAMQNRLQAMIDAAKVVEGPLDDFYASLNDEQKARFNRLGREVARSGE